MYQSPEAPASIGGVLDNGFTLYRACFKSTVGLLFVGGFIGQLPNSMLGGAVDPVSGLPEVGQPFIIALLFSVLVSVVVFGAVVIRIDGVARNVPAPLQDSIVYGCKRGLPVLGCWLLYSLAVSLGLVLLIIPGLILGLTLLFAPFAVVIDRTPVFQALKDSHVLVWGNWWRTAVLTTIAMFVIVAVYFLISIVGVASLLADDSLTPGTVPLYIELIMVPAFGALVTPLIYSLLLSVYYDLRLRRSGADLAARIDAPGNA